MAHPEWAAVGSEVAVLQRSWHGVYVRLVRVERHTRTQVILSNGFRYTESRGRYLAYGPTPASRIAPPSNPDAQEALKRERTSLAVATVIRRAKDIDARFPESRDIAALRVAIDQLEALLAD